MFKLVVGSYYEAPTLLNLAAPYPCRTLLGYTTRGDMSCPLRVRQGYSNLRGVWVLHSWNKCEHISLNSTQVLLPTWLITNVKENSWNAILIQKFSMSYLDKMVLKSSIRHVFESTDSAHEDWVVEVTTHDLVVFLLPKLLSFCVRTTQFILLRDPL